ncbi:MAG: hypothetical protein ACUZ8O_08080 [Candidatus Anammoxibacter sp.]
MATKKIADNKNDPLYKIVSKFPKVIDYRDNLMEFGRVDKYLMLIGGTYTEREACIDYVSGFSRGRTNNQSCKKIANGILRKEVIDLEDCSDLFATVLQKVSNKKSGKRMINDKLFILKDISRRHNHLWIEFKQRFNDSLYKPDFLVATTKDRDELDELPQTWRTMFEEVDLAPIKVKPKTRISNFASKDDIDKILMKYIRRYPYKSRRFVVEKALPKIEEVFAGKDIYSEGTLRTRISIVRQKIMI